MVTQAIAAMARAGVADLVDGEPRAVSELARETGLAEDTLRRILRALSALGIFRLQDDRVSNTPQSEFLRAEVDGSLHWIAQSLAGEQYQVWGASAAAFRTGAPAAEEVLGAPYFDWLGEHPAEAANFNRAMAAAVALRSQVLVGRDWSDELVVDVGGGTGGLVASLLARHPGLRGIVVDLPHSEAAARERFAAAGLEDRCEFRAGDFFVEVPVGGDAYVLSQILHDWDDEPALRILRACAAAAKPSSRLLVIDAVVPEGDGAQVPKLLDLHMLVMLGGRERTESEWRALLAAGRFELVGIDDSGAFAVIEARPLASPPTPDRGVSGNGM